MVNKHLILTDLQNGDLRREGLDIIIGIEMINHICQT